MSNDVWFPAVSFMFHSEEKKHMVQISFAYKTISARTDIARNLATDLLIWADRVDKLNNEEEE